MIGQAQNGGSQVQITADDQGPLLAIIAWVFMTMMILSVIFRLVVKLGIRGTLKGDDYAVCASLVFAVIQSVVISVGVQKGLGTRSALLSPGSIASIQKELYAADILFILASGTAKVSVLALLGQLSVEKRQAIVTKVSFCVVGVWTVVSVFVLAFQCGAVHPWDTQNGKCINKFNFWAGVSAVDMLTEIVIMALPIMMMVPVRVAMSKKITVVLAFFFRIGVPILIIVRLALLHTYYSSPDFSLDFIPSGLSTQILISISITTACIPALKPFLDSFESGALNIKLNRNTNGAYFSGNGYELQSKGDGKNKSVVGSRTREEQKEYIDITENGERKADNSSFWSGKSDEMIIKRTDQWTVETTRKGSGELLE